MAKSIDHFLLSSVGKKFVMALTGFLLVGFLIMHLAGNMTLYAAADGSKFVAYVQGIHSFGPLVWVAEVALVALFGCHVWIAWRLTRENRRARPIPYAIQKACGRSTVASRSMFVTGSVVLGFLVVHLLNFRLSSGLVAPSGEELLVRVRDVLGNPVYAAVYVIGSVVLGIHLSHGFKSAFQSLGANHPRLDRCVQRIGLVLAIVIGVGFASFPIVAAFFWNGSPS